MTLFKNISWRLIFWICFWGLIVGAVACSAVAGLLFFWASRDLPDITKLEEYTPAQTTTILARDGSILGTLSHENRYSIAFSDMPNYLPKAFLAAEDDGFYEHSGIDPIAIARAAVVNISSGSKRQGGSTITQQIIKQLLLSSERSYSRKIKEAILAWQVEQNLTKDQILLTYLNHIYLGQHSYGVESAARTYFGKNASQLTLAEAAVLAGLPQAPSRYNPFRNPEDAKNRQLYVLRRMHELKWISDAEYTQAKEEPLVYWSMQDSQAGPAQWYNEEVRRLLVEFFTPQTLEALGIQTDKSGEDYVYEAGLTVHTAMEPAHQNAAGTALKRGLVELDKRQGWRGPIKKLSPEEQLQFIDKMEFDPTNLVGEFAYTKALVTNAEEKALTVALGQGYTGIVKVEEMRWAREPNIKVAAAYAKPITDARTVASVGDIILVSATEMPEIVQEDPEDTEVQDAKTKKNKKPKPKAKPKFVDYDPSRVVKTEPINLRLQQEPLVQGALASIEPQTGDVVALIGGYRFGDSHFNRATQARRQPGSSFKPIVYSTALDFGFTPLSKVLDGPFVYVNPYTKKVWKPANYEHNYKGILPLYTALALSRNTTTVRVAQKVGVGNIIQRAKMLGLEADFPPELAISLGAIAVSPLNLTQAYAAFANQGLGVRPRIITAIYDADGKELYKQNTEHWRAISPQNAFQMTCLLRKVVNSGTGVRAKLEGYDNICGKTGTTNSERDTWFVGFSPNLATGVYVGFDQVQSLGRLEQGGRTAAPIFKYYRSKVEHLYKDKPQYYLRPDNVVMSDGLAFVGRIQEGVSAIDNEIIRNNDDEFDALGGEGEDLFRQF